MALRTNVLNFVTSFSVAVVNAKVTPDFLRRAGFSGAKSQWRISSRLMLSASPGVLTFGGSGKFTGRMIGAFVDFTASSRRYSYPLPLIQNERENSLPIFAARRIFCSSVVSKITGCFPEAAASNAVRDLFSSGRCWAGFFA